MNKRRILLTILFTLCTVTIQLMAQKKSNLFCLKANDYMAKFKYDSAIPNFNKALRLYTQAGAWQDVAVCYNKISDAYYTLSQFDQSVEAANNAIQTIQNHNETNREQEAVANVNLGQVYIVKAQHKAAMTCYKNALLIFKTIYGDDGLEVANTYRFIAEAYGSDSHFVQALTYDQMALTIYRNIYGEKHPKVAQAYLAIGTYHLMADEHQKAVEYFLKALQIYRDTEGESNMATARIYRNLGRSYVKLNQYDKVIETQKKALAIYQRIAPKDPYMVLIYWNLGDAYGRQGKHSDAVKYYQLSIATVQGLFGNKHPGLMSGYTYFADYYKNIGNYEQALLYYQRSLNANLLHFNDEDPYTHPVIADFLYQEGLLTSLLGKAEVLNKIYDLHKEAKALKAAFITYQLVDTLLDEIRHSHQEMADKIALGKSAASAYEMAIATSLEMERTTHDKRFLETAFYYSEKSKVGALTSALSDLSAKGNGLIPDSLLKFESALKQEMSQTKSSLTEASMQAQKDTVAIRQYKKKLFEVNAKLDSMIGQWDVTYPRYYQLKNSAQILSVKSLQSKLPESTAILEYLEGDENIYIFSITKNTFDVSSFPRDSVYNFAVAGYRDALLSGGSQISTPAENFTKFENSANTLFRLLVADFIQARKGISKLIIIPDGQLAYVPFEVLLLHEYKGPTGHYAELDYLLKHYAIAYNYSASLNFKEIPVQRVEPNIDYLLIAPTYATAKTDSAALEILGKFRGEVAPLIWNKREVESISKLVGEDYISDSDATESYFKKVAKDYRVLHLAMHALIDDEDPMNSKFVFTADTDSTEDGFLHAFELYTMELRAELVVLSACKTGYGKLNKGEGVMSLARAFSVSGVPAVVMSHWNVDDESTSKLMEYFYKNLAAGMPKSEALQQAKLAYLKEANPTSVSPFYWASFICVGDDSPIVRPKYLLMSIISCVALILVTVGFLFYRRRKNVSTVNA